MHREVQSVRHLIRVPDYEEPVVQPHFGRLRVGSAHPVNGACHIPAPRISAAAFHIVLDPYQRHLPGGRIDFVPRMAHHVAVPQADLAVRGESPVALDRLYAEVVLLDQQFARERQRAGALLTDVGRE